MTKNGGQSIIFTKQKMRRYRSSQSKIIQFGIKFLYAVWYTWLTIQRFCLNSNYRSIISMQVLNSKRIHQTTSTTYLNRYPEIFSASSDYFGNKQNLKILSYGCSTGEEVLTLRHYFPNAQIVGAEINKRSLEICKSLSVDKKITFIFSSIKEIEKHGPYDAIFCMSVLQRKPHEIAEKEITNLKKIYPFDKFEKQIIDLDHLLNAKGLLIVHNTQYSLWDTRVASNYQALGNYNQDNYISPIFDRHSQMIAKSMTQNTMFIKKSYIK